MIDLHTHILPRLDDGARSLDESREIARVSRANGVSTIAATPHVRRDWPTTADEMERRVDEVRRDLDRAGIDVEVLHGGEVDLEELQGLSRDELARFTLAQNGRYLLVEVPYVAWPLALSRTIDELRTAGVTPILAHPERNPDVHENPSLVADAVAAGALVQLTAASLDGRLERRAQAASRRLLDAGLVHVLASDAHSPNVREAGLRRAAEKLGDKALARYLTEEAPAAIVAGEDVPSPPARRTRRRFFR